MNALKISEMSDKQSKRWINYVQKLKNLSSKGDVQEEIDKLEERRRKDRDFSREDEEKLECAKFEMDKRKEAEKKKEQEEKEPEKKEEEPSLGQRVKLKAQNFKRKAPAMMLKTFYYLLMGFAIYSVAMMFKNIGMFWLAAGAYFLGNLINFFADLKSKRLNKKEPKSITESIKETAKEKIPVDIGGTGAWTSSQTKKEKLSDTGESGAWD